ncbi:MAG: hypothetical protein JSV20_04225, partial [Candidatus Bathyarchaeota archaeon]
MNSCPSITESSAHTSSCLIHPIVHRLSICMAMLVVVSLVQNVFLWGRTLSAEEWAHTNEHVSIDAMYFDLEYNLILEVTNVGSVQTHLVEPLDPQKTIMRYPVDQYLEVKQTKEIVLPDSGQLLNIFEDFRVTVFTERGTFGYKRYSYETSPLYDPWVGELGVFRIAWFFSKYASIQYPPDGSGTPVADSVMINKT